MDTHVIKQAAWLCAPVVRTVAGLGCERPKVMYYWSVQKH